DELVAQGWLRCESKRGTFVSDKILSIHALNRNKKQATVKEANALYLPSLTLDEIRLDEALPESKLVPIETLSRAMRHALISATKPTHLPTQNTQGTLALREAITLMLNMERGLHTKPDYICTTRSLQMSIFTVAKSLLKAGDNVVIEAPCCPKVRDAFVHCGANIISIQHHQHGIDLTDLEQLCMTHKIAAIYVTPQHHIPTTTVMSEKQKQQLLMLTERYQFKIIENDDAHELNFLNTPNLPIASAKKPKNVIYIGNLSKVLPAGLNVSYIVANNDKFIQACAEHLALIDQQSNAINELCVAELLQKGEIKKHLLRTKNFYGTRRAWLGTQLTQVFENDITFELPQNGLAVWLNIPTHYHFNLITKHLDALKLSLPYTTEMSTANTYGDGLRIGFANLNEQEIVAGLIKLKAALNQTLKKLLTA
ncbi:MAG: PLP-dependent aminotransferase family protein, partial [Methylotenera sp.]|nr:PLP-dependent aminotransferase family protein [Methylotenera sp.]